MARVTKKQQILYAVLRELGFVPPFNGPRSEDRIIAQKMLYLAQELLKRRGMTLGYLFTWYLRGPYSPELARDLSALDELCPPLKDRLRAIAQTQI